MSGNRPPVVFEIFLQRGFSEFELASVITTLEAANTVIGAPMFEWEFVSDQPGLLNGKCGMAVSAAPAIFDHDLKDHLVVIGGKRVNPEGWMPRVRAMQAQARPVVILSDAATCFIQSRKSPDEPHTTKLHDVFVLQEAGDFPNLVTSMASCASGIITSAGSGFTSELTIRLIGEHLSDREVSELGSSLMIPTIRDCDVEQPSASGILANKLEPQLARAVRTMERNIAEPLSTAEIAERAGVSVRQLERLFRGFIGDSPARFYRQMRIRNAHAPANWHFYDAH